ncbi:outer membrane transport energization protein ExbD [Novosphingobium sp. PhB165]|uniref:ExbD/TolR family protein n=1 Tax=Novosphingobium sp. PhB165 TaxID=2485105 RepID=UPI001050A6E6|nr:biopolymer transporter ExbD [Novosphingobium sp. PhB165]TCM18728.1 outer membrane transport energization protein ExbD [Novosphingobium sp. PhB165]
MAMSGGKDDGAPMMEMNTTPLIDVMLVLLIMFIITIPVATHSIDIDLPVATPPTNTPPPVDPIKNKIVLTADAKILWNGNAVDQGTLRNLLAQSLTYKVEPELQYQPEAQASYELSAQVLELIKASNVTKFGFVGNDQFREFGK